MTPTSHPDPKAGVFETMLIAEGRPVELDAHLGRLATSIAALFDDEPPPEARALARERAQGMELGRLRLTVAPNGGGQLVAEVVVRAIEPKVVFPSRERAVTLNGFVVEGGLGAHKWVDRALPEEADEGPVALLLDGDGAVLEAARANVFAVRDGALLTPPADGRILPGIARAQAIEVGRAGDIDVREVKLRVDDLLEADEVFLTGSVRGVEVARSIDGTALPSGGKVRALIAGGLRRRWLG